MTTKLVLTCVQCGKRFPSELPQQMNMGTPSTRNATSFVSRQSRCKDGEDDIARYSTLSNWRMLYQRNVGTRRRPLAERIVEAREKSPSV